MRPSQTQQRTDRKQAIISILSNHNLDLMTVSPKQIVKIIQEEQHRAFRHNRKYTEGVLLASSLCNEVKSIIIMLREEATLKSNTYKTIRAQHRPLVNAEIKELEVLIDRMQQHLSHLKELL